MNSVLPPWSYSMLEAFNSCPRQMFHKYILKEKYPETEAQRRGNAVDKAIEARIKHGAPLPEEFAHLEPKVGSVAAAKGSCKVSTQLKLGIRRDFTPCGFFDHDVWGRGVLDVLLVNKPAAMIIDWKNGKNNESRDFYDGGLQRKIFALFVFKHFPGVERITAVNQYLTDPKPGKPLAFARDDQPVLWREVLTRILEIEKAMKAYGWCERPGPLCGYCPVKTCTHNRS